MANVGTLSIDLALQSAQFIAGLKRAAAQTQATAKQMSVALDFAKGAVQGLAAAFTIDFFVRATKGAFDFADAIQDLSDKSGASTTMIQQFRYAAQLSGSSVEEADAAVAKFAKNLGEAASGNQAQIASFRALGVTSRNVDTAIRQAADGIAKLPTKAQQAAASVSLFGKSAQSLTGILSQGSSGLDQMARAANDLGIVMDSALIANAGKVNDKLDTLRMIVTAQLASTIVANADAIASLADGVTHLVTSLINFWSQNPQKAMAIMGAMAGGAAGGMIGGLPGAAIGAVAGAAGGAWAGGKMAQAMADGRSDLKFRGAEFDKARTAWKNAKAGKGGQEIVDGEGRAMMLPPDVKAAEAEFLKQGQLYKNAIVAASAARASTVKAGSIPDAKGSKAKKAPSLKSDDELAAIFDKELKSLDNARLSALQGVTNEIVEWSKLEREKLFNDHTSRVADIDANTGSDAEVRAGKKHYTELQAKQLKTIEQDTYLAEADQINHRENVQLQKEQLDARTASLSTSQDILQGDLNLARTMRERRDLELKINANRFEQERATLEATIASKDASEAEKAIARERLKALGKLQGQADASIRQQTMGPLGSYLDSIPKSADEINESLQNVAVEGLQNLNDGLTQAILQSGSLKDTFKSLTSTILSGIAKIAIQEAIIKPLGSALGGLFGGGGIGSIFGSLFGARANGGMTRAGSYLVGERGPELVNIGNTANVVSTRELQSSSGSGSGLHISFGNITSNDPAAVKAMAYQAIAEAMPMIIQNSKNATKADFNRPRFG